MKQHSYAFYTGWLSNEYLRRQRLRRELRELPNEDTQLSRVNSMVEERERLINEIENADRDLTGKVLQRMKYPNNLTCSNFLDYMFCPTLVYELEYPRTDRFVDLLLRRTNSENSLLVHTRENGCSVGINWTHDCDHRAICSSGNTTNFANSDCWLDLHTKTC